MSERPSTPPLQASSLNSAVPPREPLTPEQVKRIARPLSGSPTPLLTHFQEINRLKAKALRSQRESSNNNGKLPPTTRSASNGNLAAGQKRPYSATASNVTSTLRDARSSAAPENTSKTTTFRPLESIQPARNFTKYVEYDFSTMTDTKGGFMTAEDDPHNKALHSLRPDEKPAHMTMKEWERHRLLRSLRDRHAGPFEPGLSVLKKEDEGAKLCRECSSPEIDWNWESIFHCAICNACKERLPDKYSLLTKTEAKEDYLITDPELRDEQLLPHLERPNPHKSNWNNMMLYLRYQVEEYAIGKKWGSEEALDGEFERREGEKRKRREGRFQGKLKELKKKTRVEAYRRERAGGGGGEFGDEVGRGGKHVHDWGRAVGGGREEAAVKKCVDCGMEVEELEF